MINTKEAWSVCSFPFFSIARSLYEIELKNRYSTKLNKRDFFGQTPRSDNPKRHLSTIESNAAATLIWEDTHQTAAHPVDRWSYTAWLAKVQRYGKSNSTTDYRLLSTVKEPFWALWGAVVKFQKLQNGVRKSETTPLVGQVFNSQEESVAIFPLITHRFFAHACSNVCMCGELKAKNPVSSDENS